MLTGRRRQELNSLTDCLVYAGITAIGFAWVENIMYIAGGADVGEALVTAGLRLIMGPFAHPLFTLSIGVGVYFAMHRHNVFAKIGCILLGSNLVCFLLVIWWSLRLEHAARGRRAELERPFESTAMLTCESNK